MKEKKAEKARRMLVAGNLKGALGIYKNFPFGFTKDEKRMIEIAHETLTGRGDFYQSLGIDTAAMIAQSKEIINLKYINHES